MLIIGLAVTSWLITAKLARVSGTQERAEAAAHDVSDLLVLTHEYAMYSEERAAQQWLARQAAIVSTLEAGANDIIPVPPEALAEARSLPGLFQQLVSVLSTRTDLRNRQRNLLLNQLQASSQILADSVHSWSITTAAYVRKTQHAYHVFAITIPTLMLLILVLVTFLLNRRVFLPLMKLHQAVQATAKGDLSVRSATTANDEFGDLSRTFDAMAIDLVAELKQEIAERKRAEQELHRAGEALKESEFFFKESQRSANIGSYKADIGANRWTSSEVLDTIFGIDQDYDRSIEGWLEIVHPDDVSMMAQHLREDVCLKRENFSKEYRVIRRNDGETRWVSGLGEAKFDSHGAAVLLTGTIQDITERKRLEEERVALEQQLHHAQKLESLGVLAGGIAHDFNNILTIIIGNCSLVKMDPNRFKNKIAEIEKASERAAGLCRQMLAYAGKAQLVRTQVNFAALVDETVKMLQSSLPQHAVIDLGISPDIPPVKGDASQLSQLAMNLIINASEAIGGPQGEIKVALTRRTIAPVEAVKDHQGKAIAPGSYACLEITDNGCGMDSETRQRIFEPFFTTKFTGRGLGMSAVLGIIMSHGGALQLFSQIGEGTTFKVYLPVQTPEPIAEEGAARDVSSAPWQGSGTILLVEDQEEVKSIAKAMLKKLGFTVAEAANGKEALELYRQRAREITLVVTDMGMPVMDGYALFRELKKLDPELPIIVSSGFGDADVTSKVGRDDIAGLICKPYNFDNLQEVLKTAGFIG